MEKMEKQERRRTLGLNVTGNAERHFILLQFVVLALTMIFLLYLIFGTINAVVAKMTAAEVAELAPRIDEINFLLLVRISILFVAVFFINLILGLFYLHQLTGPLARIRVILSQIAAGTIPDEDVNLRKQDFPTEAAQALTAALKRIRAWRSKS